MQRQDHAAPEVVVHGVAEDMNNAEVTDNIKDWAFMASGEYGSRTRFLTHHFVMSPSIFLATWPMAHSHELNLGDE